MVFIFTYCEHSPFTRCLLSRGSCTLTKKLQHGKSLHFLLTDFMRELDELRIIWKNESIVDRSYRGVVTPKVQGKEDE